MRRGVFLVALAAGVLSACGGGGGGDNNGNNNNPGGSGSNTAAVTFCTNFRNAAASKLKDCFKATDAAVAAFTPGAADECADFGRVVASGRLKLDATHTAHCLEAVTSATCEQLSVGEPLEPCELAMTGTVAAGGACHDDLECAAGFCDSSAQVCPGRCVAPAGAGASCSSDDECAAGMDCVMDSASGGAVCGAESKTVGGDCPCGAGLYCRTSDGTCQQKKTAGECADFDECAAGHTCSGMFGGTGTGTCRALVGLNDSCPAADVCGAGTICHSGTCVAMKGPGAACAQFEVCMTGLCDAGACPPAGLSPGAACNQQDDRCITECGDDKKCKSFVECATP